MNKIKNNKQTADSWTGQLIQAGEYYLIESTELSRWANDSKVLSDIGSGSLIFNDGTNDILDVATAIISLRDEMIKEVKVGDSPAFTSKSIGTKKLFSRVTGKKFPIVPGVNTLDFVVPFNAVKMTGLEIANSREGETVNLKILDTASGSVSQIPSALLNQFGFEVNMPGGIYSRESSYDSDLFLGLVIRLEYTANEARDLGVNYFIHEVK
jgi:hypothetical protein